MLYTFSDLNIECLRKVQNIEKATGLKLLALNSVDVAPATIQDDALKDIQALERDLGITVVAVS